MNTDSRWHKGGRKTLIFFVYKASSRDSLYFLNGRNRYFGEKIYSNSLSKWLSKYSHELVKYRRRE
jgi:hypothetical protein